MAGLILRAIFFVLRYPVSIQASLKDQGYIGEARVSSQYYQVLSARLSVRIVWT